MDKLSLSQSLLDAADKFMIDADVKFITAARYVKKALREIEDLLSLSSSNDLKSELVVYLLHRAAEKIGDDIKKFKLTPPISDVKDLAYLYTSPHDVADLRTSDDWQSRYGSVVWVRSSKNDPWWPSYICDPRLLDPVASESLRDFAVANLGKKYLVYYYGEASKNKHGFATTNQIKDYYANRVEFETQSIETKKKTLERAIPLADSEALRDVNLRIEWVQFLHEINLEAEKLRKKSKAHLSKKKEIENLNSESFDSIDDYSAALKKDSRLIPPKKRNSEAAVVDISGKSELFIEIPARKKSTVRKISGIHDSDGRASDRQREVDDVNARRTNRLSSNKKGFSNDVVAIDSPTEMFSDDEAPIDQEAKKSSIKKKDRTDDSDDDFDDDDAQLVGYDDIRFTKDVVEVDPVSKRSHRSKAVIETARSSASVPRNSKSRSSSSINDDNDGSDTAENIPAVASKKRGRPSKASGKTISDDDEDQVVEQEDSVDAEEKEEEDYAPKKRGRPSFKQPKPENPAKLKKKQAARGVIDLEVMEILDDDSDQGPRSAGSRSSSRLVDVTVKGKGKAHSVKNHSKAKSGAVNSNSVECEDAAKGPKGRLLKNLRQDSTDSSDRGSEALGDVEVTSSSLTHNVAPLRRSSRAVVYCEDNDDDDQNQEESEESEEPSEVVQEERATKRGRPRGSATDVQPVKKNPVGKRGRPPKKSLDDAQRDQDNRKAKKKGGKDNIESDVDNDKSEDDKGADDEEKNEDEVVEFEVEVEVEVEDKIVEDIVEEIAAVELKKPLNETPFERLGRLLRLLAQNTKEGAVKLVDKAIVTMDKIENLSLTMDELKESGAAERIHLLRKHSNAAIAGKAKQVRAKWMEAARREVILAASASSVSAPLDATAHTQTAVRAEDPAATVQQTGPASPLHSSAALSPNRGVPQPQTAASDPPIDVEPTVQQDYKYEMVPDEVQSSVARSRAVRMLQMALGRAFRPSRPVCTTAAAIWLEGRVFDALCATAVQTSNHANIQHASLNSALPATASKLGGPGDTTATTQGAGSAVNRYLANVTRLTFALQMEELSLLKEKILCCCSMTQSEVSVSQFNTLINSVVLARSTTELEEIAASIRNEQNCLVGI